MLSHLVKLHRFTSTKPNDNATVIVWTEFLCGKQTRKKLEDNVAKPCEVEFIWGNEQLK